jgi:hypothetical protein
MTGLSAATSARIAAVEVWLHTFAFPEHRLAAATVIDLCRAYRNKGQSHIA